MNLIVLAYVAGTLALAGSMFFHGVVADSVVLLIGSSVGFAGGAGMRSSFYLGHRTSGVILGLSLLVAGASLLFYFDVTFSIFGVQVAGDNWPFLGFVVAFIAARREDAGIGTRQS